jgi:uncharacterized membrane protein YgdD (TMEM256/DUF423 family)
LNEADFARKKENWQTAAHYQMVHSLCLLATALKAPVSIHWAGGLFSVGILCFSGSIYALVLDKEKKYSPFMGPVTPIGGMLLIGGWVSLLFF